MIYSVLELMNKERETCICNHAWNKIHPHFLPREFALWWYRVKVLLLNYCSEEEAVHTLLLERSNEMKQFQIRCQFLLCDGPAISTQISV